MKLIKSLLAIALFTVTVSGARAAENMSADAQAVDSACASDAATASCGSDKVGTGLLKCLHAYKKANKGFKFSDSCRMAMRKMHADRKNAGK